MSIKTLSLYITSSQAISLYFILVVFVFCINACLKIRSLKIRNTVSSPTGKSRSRDWYFFISEAGLATVLLSLSVVTTMLKQPTVITPSLPLFERLSVSNSKPLTIAFDKPVGKQTIIRFNPEVRFEYQTHKTGIFPWNITSFTIMPQHSLEPDTEYLIEIQPSFPILSFVSFLKPAQQMFLFKTPELPVVTATVPAPDTDNVLVTTHPIIFIGPESTDTALWEFEIDPPVSFEPETHENDTQITLRLAKPLLQGTRYTLKVYRQAVIRNYQNDRVLSYGAKELVHEFSFRTVAPASISTFSPTGAMVPIDEPLLIAFKEIMDRQSVLANLTIYPQVSGQTLWLDEQTIRYVPNEGWQRDTEYTVRVGQEARTAQGGTLPEPLIYTFRTLGAVDILDVSPLHDSNNVPVTTSIDFTFNQPVIHSSLLTLLQIDPATPFETSWTDTTVHITPLRDLLYDTIYTIKIAPGIQSIGGIDSQKPISVSFRTAPFVFTLPIPFFRQQQMFTCYTTAVKMALSYYGVSDIDEVGFIDKIGRQSVRRDFISNTWGDPNQGVVGTYDGSGEGGYGTHWDPVARAVRTYRPTDVYRRWNIPDLLLEVQNGHPVIVWWVNALWPVKDISWNLPDGTRVYAVNGMHTSVITGWQGNRTNPDKIIVHDPALGKRSLTQKQFLDLWKWFDNTALVIR